MGGAAPGSRGVLNRRCGAPPNVDTREALLRWLPAPEHVAEARLVGYLEFLRLMEEASGHGHRLGRHAGGIQEETTFLGVPCLTLRESTERPVTVELAAWGHLHGARSSRWMR